MKDHKYRFAFNRTYPEIIFAKTFQEAKAQYVAALSKWGVFISINDPGIKWIDRKQFKSLRT